MAFKQHLEAVCSQVEGSVACSIMGFNGLPVDSHRVSEPAGMDLDGLWVEYSSLIGQIQRAAESMQGGAVKEVAIHTDKLTTVARLINPEYFLVLALSPEGNVGKGRFALRIIAPQLAPELS
jgi:predicted regulator of Ras-like GTPase activity (Roadblock/LC7/MglB family)